tara:strand:- start:57 stop:218 length:162 start_codon:yes stop_codon:yes gene_type:complete
MKTTNLQFTEKELHILFRTMNDKFNVEKQTNPKFKAQSDLITKIATARYKLKK